MSTAQVYRAWSQFPPGQPMVDRMLRHRLRTPMAIAQSLGNMLEPVASRLFRRLPVKWFLGTIPGGGDVRQWSYGLRDRGEEEEARTWRNE